MMAQPKFAHHHGTLASSSCASDIISGSALSTAGHPMERECHGPGPSLNPPASGGRRVIPSMNPEPLAQSYSESTSETSDPRSDMNEQHGLGECLAIGAELLRRDSGMGTCLPHWL